MLSSYAEIALAKILSYGAALTAVFVVSNSVTDPVNTPKLLVLGVVGAAALGAVLASLARIRKRSTAITAFLVLLFLIAAFNSAMLSESPFSQNMYGVYGRNNGLITYIFLSFVFLAASLLTAQKSFESVTKGLIFTGIVNIVYCGWVILFGDFIGWSNPYGNILGTFGNPNFIGAFLGIFLSAYVAYAISPKRSMAWKYSLILVMPVTLFEIIDSSAIQGRVVAAGGLALVAFSYLRFRSNKVLLGLYSLAGSAVGMFAILGALQIGPLTQYIYKTSVSLRGQYWLSGWNAGQSHPFSGVGMDALGDWYRRVRDPQALLTPGVNTVVNTAHNVFMDMFAFGGWPLFIAYILLVAYSGYALVRTFIRLNEFDGTFVAIAVAWVGYQVQSVISINQIGIAIWGWLLGGILIAYERATRGYVTEKINVEKKIEKSFQFAPKNADVRVIPASFIAALIGLVIVLPPFVSDTKWKSAMNAQSLPLIEASMNSSYFNPQNVNRYIMNIRLLEESNFKELAYRYALEAVAWNPESFESWRFLYFVSKSTPADKELALAKMKELDPLNPNVAAP
jgi:hypothetical protein